MNEDKYSIECDKCGQVFHIFKDQEFVVCPGCGQEGYIDDIPVEQAYSKKCDMCGEKLLTAYPYKCERCGCYFCINCRIPENHNCVGLSESSWGIYREEQIKQGNFIPSKTKVKSSSILNIYKKDDIMNKHHHKKKRHSKRRYTLSETFLYKLKRFYRKTPKSILFSIPLLLILPLLKIYLVEQSLGDMSVLIDIIFYISLVVYFSHIMIRFLKRMDRIYVGSDLRLFGLKILSGIISFVGGYLSITFLWFGLPLLMMAETSFESMRFIYSFLGLGFLIDIFTFGSEFYLPYTGIIIYLVITLGLAVTGGYLFFKFQRRTGQFVWFG